MTWWKDLQEEREKLDKRPIKNWKAMVSKVKEQYLLEDYEIQLHKKRQILKQKDVDVATYTNDFQNLCLRSRVKKDEIIKVDRYLGGFKWNIQEQISLWTPTIVHKYFQLALKVEEKNKKNSNSNFK